METLDNAVRLLAPYLANARVLSPGLMFVVGAVAAFFGASTWRWGRILGGLAVGVAAGFWLGDYLARPGLVAIAVLTIGISTAVAFYFIERAAIAVLGGALGWLVGALIVRQFFGGAYVEWAQGGGALLGLLCSGYLHQPAIKAVTAFLGALLIVGAFGTPTLIPVAVLGGVGWAWQMRAGSGGGKPTKKSKKK